MDRSTSGMTPPLSPGEKYERLAFTFCRAATIILLAGKFALPVASGACAALYVLTALHGKRDTRCVLRIPLLIAGFWGTICAISIVLLLRRTGHP